MPSLIDKVKEQIWGYQRIAVLPNITRSTSLLIRVEI